MTKSYHMNELAISLILLATVKSLNCYNFWRVSGSLLLFHQAPQFEKENGAEYVGNSQEPHFGQFHKLK